ncbi:hypothetical protein TWF694_007451 [Orbilia ellipsospora]|uniref:Pet127-domain-containing protein n=1 Tax=Orbilia ellipsospora TaxID=2528407 RepID=A0AAV9XHT4_9PEZI
MLRMSPSLGRFRLSRLPIPSSPWVCRACQIHASASLRIPRLQDVSFPPAEKLKTKKKLLRVEESMSEAEKEIVRTKQAKEHRAFIARLEDYIEVRKREIKRGLKLEEAQKKKARASLVLQTAKRLRVTPRSWPTISKKAITSEDLMMLYMACKETIEEIKKNGDEIPAELQFKKWIDIAKIQNGSVEPKQETTGAQENVSETTAEDNTTVKEDEPLEERPDEPPKEQKSRMTPKEKKLEVDAVTINSRDFVLKPIDVKQDVELRPLSHGLDRVLFNPGVTFLRDPRSRVYNFDPYLDTIMPVDEFDFDALGDYITSSKDTTLIDLAKGSGKKYVGSTSSMTGILSHLHYLISRWRPLTLTMLSKGFVTESENFTRLSRLPVSVILRWKDGVYAIDQDKDADTIETILLFLGRSMEKMLTLPPEVFQKYHKSKSHEIPEEVKNARERYHYTAFEDLLFRSQLDAHDSRLPGTGVFDLKTRGVVSIRMNAQEPAAGWGYQIKTADGQFESFEREYYDLIRSAFMKYSLQVRMGRMDGCFVAYHNTKQIFGFQYVSIDEMDEALHSGPEIGDQEFKFSLKLLNEALNRATEKYPGQSLRLWFETRESTMPFLYFAAEPLTEEEARASQDKEADLNVVLEQIKKERRDDWLQPSKSWLQQNLEEIYQEIPDIAGSNSGEPVQAVEKTSTGDAEIGAGTPMNEEGKSADEKRIENLQESANMLESVTVCGQTLIDTKETEGEVNADANAETASENITTPGEESTAEQSQSRTPKDCLVQVLVAQSIVNGEKVVRPVNLSKKDNWALNYAFLDMKPAAAQKTIDAMKKRKQDGVEFDANWRSTFMKHLYKLSQDGEKRAEKQKQEDAEGDIVVYRRRD